MTLPITEGLAHDCVELDVTDAASVARAFAEVHAQGRRAAGARQQRRRGRDGPAGAPAARHAGIACWPSTSPACSCARRPRCAPMIAARAGPHRQHREHRRPEGLRLLHGVRRGQARRARPHALAGAGGRGAGHRRQRGVPRLHRHRHRARRRRPHRRRHGPQRGRGAGHVLARPARCSAWSSPTEVAATVLWLCARRAGRVHRPGHVRQRRRGDELKGRDMTNRTRRLTRAAPTASTSCWATTTSATKAAPRRPTTPPSRPGCGCCRAPRRSRPRSAAGCARSST